MEKAFPYFLALYALSPIIPSVTYYRQHHNETDATAVNPSPAVTSALCVVRPLGDSGVEGAVTFAQKDGYVLIAAEVTGLTPGEHGFHIHEFGECHDADGARAGGHFNPNAMPHGGPDDSRRHAGDLGNLVADREGVAKYQRKDKLIRLNGESSILGRSVIIHADPDDFKTQPSGNAGKRIACGAIEAAMED
ncbi:superoxide dismutase family protein [Planctomycetes bacterium TBK1r]|uniref:Superoxide dismutase [Cu-Zn] n=1 Tax=Stieleria magnilauensis TaxID=2527963 RepID=A0ABX5XUZ3_9BACT|nr:Superoxide dismutase [Cu-Zn] precursor [Planctomycetes bacterium TBK1r]